MNDLFGAFDDDSENEIREKKEQPKKLKEIEFENDKNISKKRKRDKNMGYESKSKKNKVYFKNIFNK